MYTANGHNHEITEELRGETHDTVANVNAKNVISLFPTQTETNKYKYGIRREKDKQRQKRRILNVQSEQESGGCGSFPLISFFMFTNLIVIPCSSLRGTSTIAPTHRNTTRHPQQQRTPRYAFLQRQPPHDVRNEKANEQKKRRKKKILLAKFPRHFRVKAHAKKKTITKRKVDSAYKCIEKKNHRFT